MIVNVITHGFDQNWLQVMEDVGTEVINKNCVLHIKWKLSIVSAFWEAT
jgi:hypothetical protein